MEFKGITKMTVVVLFVSGFIAFAVVCCCLHTVFIHGHPGGDYLGSRTHCPLQCGDGYKCDRQPNSRSFQCVLARYEVNVPLSPAAALSGKAIFPDQLHSVVHNAVSSLVQKASKSVSAPFRNGHLSVSVQRIRVPLTDGSLTEEQLEGQHFANPAGVETFVQNIPLMSNSFQSKGQSWSKNSQSFGSILPTPPLPLPTTLPPSTPAPLFPANFEQLNQSSFDPFNNMWAFNTPMFDSLFSMFEGSNQQSSNTFASTYGDMNNFDKTLFWQLVSSLMDPGTQAVDNKPATTPKTGTASTTVSQQQQDVSSMLADLTNNLQQQQPSQLQQQTPDFTLADIQNFIQQQQQQLQQQIQQHQQQIQQQQQQQFQQQQIQQQTETRKQQSQAQQLEQHQQKQQQQAIQQQSQVQTQQQIQQQQQLQQQQQNPQQQQFAQLNNLQNDIFNTMQQFQNGPQQQSQTLTMPDSTQNNFHQQLTQMPVIAEAHSTNTVMEPLTVQNINVKQTQPLLNEMSAIETFKTGSQAIGNQLLETPLVGNKGQNFAQRPAQLPNVVVNNRPINTPQRLPMQADHISPPRVVVQTPAPNQMNVLNSNINNLQSESSSHLKAHPIDWIQTTTTRSTMNRNINARLQNKLVGSEFGGSRQISSNNQHETRLVGAVSEIRDQLNRLPQQGQRNPVTTTQRLLRVVAPSTRRPPALVGGGPQCKSCDTNDDCTGGRNHYCYYSPECAIKICQAL